MIEMHHRQFSKLQRVQAVQQRNGIPATGNRHKIPAISRKTDKPVAKPLEK